MNAPVLIGIDALKNLVMPPFAPFPTPVATAPPARHIQPGLHGDATARPQAAKIAIAIALDFARSRRA